MNTRDAEQQAKSTTTRTSADPTQDKPRATSVPTLSAVTLSVSGPSQERRPSRGDSISGDSVPTPPNSVRVEPSAGEPIPSPGSTKTPITASPEQRLSDPLFKGPAASARVGLCLGGGGAKGDFEVGAVKYLYQLGVRPHVICGTSVGAINAAKLAEGEGGLESLEQIWMSLTHWTDMYEDESWMDNHDERIKVALNGRRLMTVQGHTEGLYQGDLFSNPKNLIQSMAWLVANGVPLLNFAADAMAQPSFFNLRPIERRLRGQNGVPKQLDIKRIRAWAATGNKLRLSMVSLESGSLRYMTESGAVIERDGSSTLDLMMQAGGEIAKLQSEIREIQSKIVAGMAAMRSVPPQARAAYMKAVMEANPILKEKRDRLAALVRANPSGRVPLQSEIETGVLASATMPAYFFPVRIGSETYVDGGVREIIPVSAAIQAGANWIVAIGASQLNPKSITLEGHGNAIGNLMRSVVELSLNEIENTDLQPEARYTTSGVTVISISPAIEMHDALTIYPAYISINMAYGYMRAADVLNPPAQVDVSALHETSELLTRKRFEITENECVANGVLPPQGKPYHGRRPDYYDTLRYVREQKRDLYQWALHRKQRGGVMPPDWLNWTHNWERHPESQKSKLLTPWDAFFLTPADGVAPTVEPDSSPAFEPNVWYAIVSKSSGRCIDLDYQGIPTKNGAKIHQWERNGQDNQSWRFEPVGDGYYKIISKSSGNCVDVTGASTDNAARIQQWDFNGTDNQKWAVTPSGSYYVLRAKHSGRVLDVVSGPTSPASYRNGCEVCQFDDHGAANQRWALIRLI